MITSIKKRDGRIVPFDQEKIEQAIEKSFMASGSQKSQETAQELLGEYEKKLLEQLKEQ